jgi:CheY-like chemotaxis protein
MAARTSAKTAPPAYRLIYVEDDVVSICVAQQVVATRPHLALVTAPSPDRALKLARSSPPEVILVNLELAGMDAATLIQILRANPATQSCPVLALGIEATPQAAVKALEAGCFLYLAKPLQPGPLGDALDYALEFSALERAEL